jgi:hypothetical protein
MFLRFGVFGSPGVGRAHNMKADGCISGLAQPMERCGIRFRQPSKLLLPRGSALGFIQLELGCTPNPECFCCLLINSVLTITPKEDRTAIETPFSAFKGFFPKHKLDRHQ